MARDVNQGADPLVVGPGHGFDTLFGLELVDDDPAEGELRGRVVVRPELLDRNGTLHAGVIAATAEALASRGTAAVTLPHGGMPSGLGNNTSVIRGLNAGALLAEARARFRSDSEWLWSITMTDQDGELVALSQVTIAVRPPR